MARDRPNRTRPTRWRRRRPWRLRADLRAPGGVKTQEPTAVLRTRRDRRTKRQACHRTRRIERVREPRTSRMTSEEAQVWTHVAVLPTLEEFHFGSLEHTPELCRQFPSEVGEDRGAVGRHRVTRGVSLFV